MTARLDVVRRPAKPAFRWAVLLHLRTGAVSMCLHAAATACQPAAHSSSIFRGSTRRRFDIFLNIYINGFDVVNIAPVIATNESNQAQASRAES